MLSRQKIGQQQCGDQMDSWIESYFEGFEVNHPRREQRGFPADLVKVTRKD